MLDSQSTPAQGGAGSPAAAEPASRGGLALTLATVASLLAIPAFGVFWLFDQFQPLDDAYFYTRYARNFLADGAVAWNPGGAPSFGPTSAGYVFVLLPLIVVLGSDTAALLTAGALGAAVCVAALLAAVRVVAAPGIARRSAWVVVAFGVAFGAPVLARVATNGMDTTLAMAFVAVLIWRYAALAERPTTGAAVVTGALGALAFAARPDLLLFAAALPAALIVLGPGPALRRAGLIAGCASAAVLGLELTLAWLHFGRPLPLSFYAKAMGGFSAEMHEMFVGTPVKEGLRFGYYNVVFGAVYLLDCVTGRGRWSWWRNTSTVERAVLAATAAFGVYYLCFVLQMLGDNARFYQPLMPALAFLALCATSRLATRWSLAPMLRSPGRAIATCALLVGVAGAHGLPQILGHQPAKRARAAELGRFDIASAVAAFPRDSTWFGISELAKLPADLTIALTEVGHPGSLCAHQKIADLSGLNDSWIVDNGGFTAEGFFAQYQPDVIYMVFPTYPRVDAALRGSAKFRDEYILIEDAGDQGVAIWKHSPHFEALRQIF